MFDPRFHGRKSNRLTGYDYAGFGAYFITICAARRGRLFGRIKGGVFVPNDHGHLIVEAWLETATVRQEVTLDAWVLMPDHFHALLWIENDSTSSEPIIPRFGYRVPRSLGSLVAGWKSSATSRVYEMRETRGWPLVQIWQRNYHDHILRDESELPLIREYIENNPARWEEDEHFD